MDFLIFPSEVLIFFANILILPKKLLIHFKYVLILIKNPLLRKIAVEDASFTIQLK